jgi:hypothetical protein
MANGGVPLKSAAATKHEARDGLALRSPRSMRVTETPNAAWTALLAESNEDEPCAAAFVIAAESVVLAAILTNRLLRYVP